MVEHAKHSDPRNLTIKNQYYNKCSSAWSLNQVIIINNYLIKYDGVIY